MNSTLPLCAKPGCPNPVKRKAAMYCSYLCANQSKPGRGPKFCVQCGKPVKWSGTKVKHCSHTCRAKTLTWGREEYLTWFEANVDRNGTVPPHMPHLGQCWTIRDKVGRANTRRLWQMVFGPLREDQFVLHHCDNLCCVNWSHLFLGNQAANMKDMQNKGRGRE